MLPCMSMIGAAPGVSEIGSTLPGSMLAVATASYRPGTNSKTLPATITVVRSASTTIHPRRRRMTRTWLIDTIGLLCRHAVSSARNFVNQSLEYPLVDHNDVAPLHLVVERSRDL